MKYTSETIQRIVKSESALKALERITPIYGEAENFLYLLQAIGAQIDLLLGYGRIVQEEAIPQTSSKMISYWEQSYGLVSDTSLSIAQRRDKLLAKIRSKPPMNKYKMEQLISATAGVKATINENTDKNTFTVYLYARDESELLTGESVLRDAIDRVKPAHTIYKIVYSQPILSNLYTGGIIRTYKNIEMKQVN